MTRVDKGDQEVGKARMRMSDPILARENEIDRDDSNREQAWYQESSGWKQLTNGSQ